MRASAPERQVARPARRRLYKVGVVADITDLPAHVLRYWETEFPSLRPGKTRGGQRLYSPEDIELILEIKNLLYEQGFTITGARRRLLEDPAQSPVEPQEELREALDEVRAELRAILTLMEADDKQ
ncbi:MAG: MerR family transcriptional regulator [Acidobacteriota bacterium]